ncbi:uncharacterized protein Z518_11173 [Rhinocladiella mackenziei CBS 650.93]|uniref:Rhinocladiella mackenziei CBS 650.93 unplaced genomic scaffold supercont1.12, whole genome shotgun sequence n=1 Tax=Rhinocladiella mackenziei CBS 650.93 TaxID=1442369 RepID=A0A0D2IRS7_9EURO|nr:uncharacterized protein Z518_11173 [Rhinocladiella mackenziei CBS 650.93]KIW99434.1 hypothetical protein Z518_11173 [Rhinocladiella mackenziei CBS 650.93]
MSSSAKRPKRNTGPWSSLRILNSTSPILSKDLHGFLVTCISGWNDNYNEAEKRTIIDSLPPQYRKYELDGGGRLVCPISIDFLLEDAYVKAAIPKFKRDVSDGYYEKGWQNQARKALQERQDGKFDAYLQEHAEQVFAEQQARDDSSNPDQADVVSSDGEWPGMSANGRRKSLPRTQVRRPKTNRGALGVRDSPTDPG